MLLDVGTFCSWVEGDLNGLLEELQEVTGRSSDWEAFAWERSLPKLSQLLASSQLEGFHLSLGHQGSVSLEYRLPSSASWCDAVLLGHGADSPVALILELKEWDISLDTAGPSESLIRRQGRLQLHPSDQVRGYAEYCRNFHSTILTEGAQVEGCTFFTTPSDAAAYCEPPHQELVAQYPVFTAAPADLEEAFPAYVNNLLEAPDVAFAEAFERGRYVQNRAFVEQIAEKIKDPSSTQFVLLDEQRAGFELAMDAITGILDDVDDGKKSVVLIEGPPGSGKSVLAAHLWAALVQSHSVAGNVVLVTTSGCQRTNWEHLFEQSARSSGGRGVVMPANRFNPGLSPTWVKGQRETGLAVAVADWRANIELFARVQGQPRLTESRFDVSIVDEAHALIDPTAPGAEGVPPSGWTMHAGPQAWHIIDQSRVSIFLLDSDQSYRDNETTTTASIERWATEFGAPLDDAHCISLAGQQFRCGGSAEYVAWAEALLRGDPASDTDCAWRKQASNPRAPFEFEIHASPRELEEALRLRQASTDRLRLVAAYGRPWVTKKCADPHALPAHEMDFNINLAGEEPWARIWNYAPDSDYTLFIQSPLGSAMFDDPLSEVGCPYVVRGFDYDYLGLLWLNDLVWRTDGWRCMPEHIFESAWPRTKAAAKREAKQGLVGPAHEQLMQRLMRGYRILLTRAIKGLHVWFEDDETRAHVEGYLKSQESR